MGLLSSLSCSRMNIALPVLRSALSGNAVKLAGFENKLVKVDIRSNLCWAAVAVTGARYILASPGFGDHCALAAGVVAGCSGKSCTSASCDVPILLQEGVDKVFGHSVPATRGELLSFMEVVMDVGSVGQGRPILCETDGGSHAVLVWGYLPGSPEEYVYRADPADFNSTDSWSLVSFKKTCTLYYRI